MKGIIMEGYYNSCGCGGSANDKGQTVPVTLTFKREELIEDIKNYAFVEGDILTPEEAHAKHQVQDIVEDGNVDRVTRVMDLVFDECVELLYPFTKENVEGGEVLDDTLRYETEYIISMNVPVTFSKTTLRLLERLIHEYIVYRVMYDWMGIANIINPKSAESWRLKAEDLKARITNALSHRTKGPRRKTRPFDG